MEIIVGSLLLHVFSLVLRRRGFGLSDALICFSAVSFCMTRAAKKLHAGQFMLVVFYTKITARQKMLIGQKRPQKHFFKPVSVLANDSENSTLRGFSCFLHKLFKASGQYLPAVKFVVVMVFPCL